MYLLGVSGGVDSMFLLEQYKDQEVIVAHVNYHQRPTAKRDEMIVKQYCEDHNIKFFVKHATLSKVGNFQDEARKIRYEFFNKVYIENNCNKLLLAHHKDDFIETALMQKESKRQPFFYGIKPNNEIMGMKIERPFIHKYFKADITQAIKAPYGIDETNFSNKYRRNVIRKNISSWTLQEKETFYQKLLVENKSLFLIHKHVEETFDMVKQKMFDLKEIRNIKTYRNQFLFYLLNKVFVSPKVSSQKIAALWDFIEGLEGNKNFKVNDQDIITKKAGKLFFNNPI